MLRAAVFRLLLEMTWETLLSAACLCTSVQLHCFYCIAWILLYPWSPHEREAVRKIFLRGFKSQEMD